MLPFGPYEVQAPFANVCTNHTNGIVFALPPGGGSKRSKLARGGGGVGAHGLQQKKDE